MNFELVSAWTLLTYPLTPVALTYLPTPQKNWLAGGGPTYLPPFESR